MTIANVAPVITGDERAEWPVAQGGSASVTTNYTDVGTQDTHKCTYSWDDGTPNTTVTAPGRNGPAPRPHTYAAAGVYTVGVTVTDDDGGSGDVESSSSSSTTRTRGFVTGGGWINSPAGAYAPTRR